MSVFPETYVDRELMVLLMDIMKVSPYAQLLRRINQYSSIINLRLHISKNVPVDQRCYDSPSADQVAAIWVEGNDDANIPQNMDIVACGRDGQTHQIQHYYGYYDSLQYPFFSVRGQWVAAEYSEGKKWQFVVDMYIKLETMRLDYYRRHQSEIRSDLYRGVVDSVANGESRGSEVEQRVVLPASFIGGQRDMRRRYLDAIALVQKFGKPDLFITMTCNPDWKEIRENLFEGQLARDRPDLVSRVFRAKLLGLMDQILKKVYIFGHVVAYVYVIEFQKQGLPYCHMIIILQSNYKINSPERFDSYVVAELPDKDVFPRLRRNDGRSVEVQNCTMNSQWVVPYNPYLLYRYDCHINVEICSGLTTVKYLYKYIYKGLDKISVHLSPHSSNSFVDEIRAFQDARWVSAPESVWRIFEFDLNEISHAVINLHLHLLDKHMITFSNYQNLGNVLASECVSKLC
ncbi:uncharacterized protein LOC142519842 [Primulina tabacum]|uniref:uncharacterized protein LOC142519842 n=1 Tax=Primulina tabacum TaxID=48773 RepID=UPI003F5919B7